MRFVFSGIQGSGKGTQARKLVEKYNFRLLEIGGEFRRVVASKSELGQKIQALIDVGDQVSPELGAAVMEDAIQNTIDNYKDEHIIFDGFIRNDWNKEIFDRLLPDYKVVLFELSEKNARERLLGRMFNPITGETFPSGTTLDPITGEKLIKRADDNEAGIIKRIELYRDVTLPIIEIQKKEGRVIEINADQSPDKVFEALEQKLKLIAGV